MVTENTGCNGFFEKLTCRYKCFSLFFLLLLTIPSVTAQDTDTLCIDSGIRVSMLLSEISGMAHKGNYIYAINDGDNGPYVFRLNISTGEMSGKYRFENLENHDWEELSVFDNYLYIGDFGNNRAERKNLAIYRINIDSLLYPAPPVNVTRFSYGMQMSYERSRHDHEWDCEAMTVTSDGIYCFSKNWKNMVTMMYHFNEGGNNNLFPVDSFNAGFLVTGAYFDAPSRSLYLCGYNENNTYLLRFTDIDKPSFSVYYKKYIIPELKNTQVESVFVDGNYIYLASERRIKAQAIYRIAVSCLNNYERR